MQRHGSGGRRRGGEGRCRQLDREAEATCDGHCAADPRDGLAEERGQAAKLRGLVVGDEDLIEDLLKVVMANAVHDETLEGWDRDPICRADGDVVPDEASRVQCAERLCVDPGGTHAQSRRLLKRGQMGRGVRALLPKEVRR